MIENINIEHKVKGRLRLVVKGPDGEDRIDTGWFDNLITNQGLDMMGGYLQVVAPYTYASAVGVGTGTATPSVTDTNLTSFLASVAASTDFETQAYIPGPPAYWSGVYIYNFAIGAVVGNIAEVGVGNNNTTSMSLFNHQLILVGGVPGTISVTSTDQLSVYFELDMYLNTTDTSYSFIMNSVTYSGIYRLSNIGTVPYFLHYLVNGAGAVPPRFIGYNGTIGAITGVPSGASGQASGFTAAAYSVGTYTRSFTTSMALADVNLSGGISAFTFETNHGKFQFSCSPVLPKNSLSTITLNWAVSWARYP